MAKVGMVSKFRRRVRLLPSLEKIAVRALTKRVKLFRLEVTMLIHHIPPASRYFDVPSQLEFDLNIGSLEEGSMYNSS